MHQLDIVKISQNIRNLKDEAKKNVKKGFSFVNSLQESDVKIVLPKYLFENEYDLRADMHYCNGFIIDLKGDLVVVDPSTDFYSRLISSGYSALQIKAIIVTHEHLDHIDGLNILLDKIIRNGDLNVELYLPNSAYNGRIPEYYKEKIASNDKIKTTLLDANKGQLQSSILLDKYKIEFLEMFHGCPDTFGFKIKFPDFHLGHITDTGYAITVQTDLGVSPVKEVVGNFTQIIQKHYYIKDFYSSVDYAVVNINDIAYNRHSKYHLSAYDLQDIFEGSKLKKLILQHLLPINIEEEDSNYLYKLFFYDQKYQTIIPHYLKKTILL